MLNWETWKLHVRPAAKTAEDAVTLFKNGKPTPEILKDLVISRPDGYTAIELPYRLMISPTEHAAWAHSTEPVDHKTKYTELWHTRLAVRGANGAADETDFSHRTIRAIWSPDFRDKSAKDWPIGHKPMVPFRMPLDVQDRHEIVHLTSNYDIDERTDCKDSTKIKPYIPSPIQVTQLMLTALGGWLDSRGAWEPPKVADATTTEPARILTVEEWRHMATMGRDHYVRVVYKGFLLPFGHRASLIKVTERKIQQNKDGVWGAYLRQRMYIVVRQVKKEFPGLGQCCNGRRFPWRAVEVITLATPSLDPPDYEAATLGADQSHFWPTIEGIPYRFTFRLWDVDGRLAECSAPVVFADASVASDIRLSKSARDLYNNPNLKQRRNVPFRGQKVAFATSKQPGDSQYDSLSIRFLADEPESPEDAPEKPKAKEDFYECLYIMGQPFFYPRIESADLDPAAVRRISGNPQPVTVDYAQTYVDYGFDPAKNRGEVFLEIVNSKLALTFGSTGNGDQAGGVITPNTNIVGFSRQAGPVGGAGRPNSGGGRARSSAASSLDKVASGEFDPLDFFGGAIEGAKILGGISLWDIIRPLAPGLVSNLEKAPKMLEETLYPAIQKVVDAEGQVIKQLDKLPDVVRNKFSAEIQHVHDSFARVTANESDLKLQAQLIRSIIQLGDRFRAVLEDPNQLLETVLQDLAPWVDDYKKALLASVEKPFTYWKDFYDTQIDAIESQLTGLALGALAYADQIQSYRTQIQETLGNLRAQLKIIQTFAADPAKLAELLGPALGAFLTAQIPALASLDDTRKRLVALTELAKSHALGKLDDFRKALVKVQAWSVGNALQAEQMVQNFEAQCLIWIATLPENVGAGPTLTRKGAQQLVRQAAATMRSVARLSGQTDFTTIQQVKNLQQVQRQVLSALQQLQLLVLDPTKALSAAAAALAVSPDQQAFLESLNTLAARFSIVDQALDATKFESLFDGIKTILPAQLKGELDALEGSPTEPGTIAFLRASIVSAGAQAKQTLVTAQLELFDLWVRYQNPYKLAVDIFGLNQQDIDRLKALEDQYKAIIQLAKAVQASLAQFKPLYDNFVTQLPPLVQQLLAVLAKNVTASLNDVVNAATDDALLEAERRAIGAVVDLFVDVMKRIQHPLQDLEELLNAKNLFEEVIKSIGIPDSVTLSYDWSPEIKSFQPVFEVAADSKLSITARITASLNGKAPTYSVDGSLTTFKVNLIGDEKFISVYFAYLKFSSHSGAKPDCEVRIEKVELAESMQFVQKLQELLSPKDGPFLEWKDLGIRTGYRFGIPAISVGAFSLQSLRLLVGITLPFNGEPARCEFGISERDHPFLLSVGIFGGGGFLSMRLGLDGVEKLEGALEFGVVAEISIGIATGGGFIVAGVYFSVEKSSAMVCGFVHAHGHLDILGIVSMDVDVLVQVCYRSNSGNVEGEATYIVSIHMLFFNQDIPLHAHYQFAGSSNGTNAAQRVRQDMVQGASAKQFYADSQLSKETRGLGEVPYTLHRELAPTPKAGEYCDLAWIDDWNRYRGAFAW
jgi:hypothetical protein